MEEIYKFEDDVLLKFNPQTNEWEEEDKKKKEYILKAISIGGVKEFKMKPFKYRKIMKALVELGIPFKMRSRPADKEYQVVFEVDKTDERETWFLPIDKAVKLKENLEPLSDIVKVKIEKMREAV